jgi:uncharacterized membrane protein (DUF2068 family)
MTGSTMGGSVMPRAAAPDGRGELALRLIIVGKLVKAIFVLTTAAIFAALLLTGSSVHLHGFATSVREHVTEAWSVYLANAVISVTERRHLAVATGALLLDGTCTSLEWYALRRGHTWGEWLVVVATSSLLPFEVVALVHHHHVGRFVILIVNLAIVVYLALHALRHHQRVVRERQAGASP